MDPMAAFKTDKGLISLTKAAPELTTTSDYTNIEKERGNSIFSSIMHVPWKESKINIIDTPGYDDFSGEVISSLKVADTGVILLNAVNGVEVGTEIIWDYMQRFETPGLFVINHCDKDKSDFSRTLDQAKQRFGNNVVPIQYPLNQGTEFDTIVDSLRMVMYKFGPDGGKPEKIAIPGPIIDCAKSTGAMFPC